jgi:hypothetical protein
MCVLMMRSKAPTRVAFFLVPHGAHGIVPSASYSTHITPFLFTIRTHSPERTLGAFAARPRARHSLTHVDRGRPSRYVRTLSGIVRPGVPYFISFTYWNNRRIRFYPALDKASTRSKNCDPLAFLALVCVFESSNTISREHPTVQLS